MREDKTSPVAGTDTETKVEDKISQSEVEAEIKEEPQQQQPPQKQPQTAIVKKLRPVPSDHAQHPECLPIETQNLTTRADMSYNLWRLHENLTGHASICY